MKERLERLVEPHDKIFFCILVMFSLIDMMIEPRLGCIELLMATAAVVITLREKQKHIQQLSGLLNSIGKELEDAGKDAMLNAPFPMVIFRLDSEEIVWANDSFMSIVGEENCQFSAHIHTAVPDFPLGWLETGQSLCPREQRVGDQRFQVFGHLSGDRKCPLATTFWVDITELAERQEEFYATRPTVSFIIIDNYEEVTRGISEKERADVRSSVEELLTRWLEPAHGLLMRYERGRYLMVCEEQYLKQFEQEEFGGLLNGVRSVVSSTGVNATLSIGVGMGGGFGELYERASVALDMALSRGGDQAVIRSPSNFRFFGGHAKEREMRTKVKVRVTATALERLIRASEQVIVMGHRNSDMDCIGAAVGVAAICGQRNTPVHIVKDARSAPGDVVIQRMKTNPRYRDIFITPEEAENLWHEDTLLVVVDTNRPNQVVAPALLEKQGPIAVIDHHRRASEYIEHVTINCHEPYASSASELVSEMIEYTIEAEGLERLEAEALLAGIMLDTKSFTVRTGGRTFEAAAFLRRCGADTTQVKKLFQSNLEDTIRRNTIIQNSEMYKPGIAIGSTTENVGRVIAAQAADALLNVEGVHTSFVMYMDGDTAVLSGRSSGEINVQVILEVLGGGGNAAAAGAQVANSGGAEQVLARLHRAVDGYLAGKIQS